MEEMAVNLSDSLQSLEPLASSTPLHKKEEPERIPMCFQCQFCNKITTSMYEARKHDVSHLPRREQKYMCNVCCANFSTSYMLRIHLKCTHLTKLNKCPDKEECIICHTMYRTAGRLVTHMQSIHKDDSLVKAAEEVKTEGKKVHQCPICKLYLKSGRLRAIHSIMVHETAPYKCKCSALFFTKGIFDFHKLNHSEYKIKNPKHPSGPKALITSRRLLQRIRV